MFACKANSLSSILEVLKDLGSDFDVASKGELEQVLKTGANPSQLICTGPSKSREYLEFLMDQGVSCFVLESASQLRNLQELAKERSQQVDAVLRIQLIWDGDNQSVLGGSKATVFGLEPRDWQKILREQALDHVNLLGVHCFQWGNMTSLDELAATWAEVEAVASRFCDDVGIAAQVLDLGGGLGLDYTNSQLTEYSWKEAFDVLKELKSKSVFENIWLEPGRFSVGNSGVYFTRIVDRKHSRGKNFLVLESGMNHLLRPALTGESFPVELAFRESGDPPVMEFDLHGPLCTALDWVGQAKLPPDVQAGDWLMFSKVGAYGFTESMPLFLCHDMPAEIVWSSGEMKMVRSSLPAKEMMK